MKCPRCGLKMEICDNNKCKNSPHLTCTSYTGCGNSIKISAKEVFNIKWREATRGY